MSLKRPAAGGESCKAGFFLVESLKCCEKAACFFLYLCSKKCPEPESNQRHEDFQSSALPTELSGHFDFQMETFLNIT